MMTNEEIKYMVNRFLQWRLPENFNPDGGISFKHMVNENTPYPRKSEPVGTNLFDYTQAEEMVRYMVDGMPMPEISDKDGWMYDPDTKLTAIRVAQGHDPTAKPHDRLGIRQCPACWVDDATDAQGAMAEVVEPVAALAEKPAERPADLRNILGVSHSAELDANISELRRDGRFKMAANLEFWKNKFTELAAERPASVQGSGDVELAAQYAEVYMSDYYLDRLAAEFAAIRQSAREAALEALTEQDVAEAYQSAPNWHSVLTSLQYRAICAARAQGEEGP